MFTLMTMLGLGTAQALDYTAYGAALAANVSTEGVSYPALAADRSGLDGFVGALAGTDAGSMSAPEQFAFWINAYNALTLTVILDAYPLGSIQELDEGNVWGSRSFEVAGQTVTLNTIEHTVLRPLGDPRVHAAVNCASKGCPPLASAPFLGETLDAQLDQASAAWIRASGLSVDRDAKIVHLSKIFDWYGDDFLARYGAAAHDIPGLEGKQEAAINFASGYVDAELHDWLQAGGYTVAYSDYDWRLNAR